MSNILPISAVIATRDRSCVLRSTLESFLEQDCLPSEFVIADSSLTDATESLAKELAPAFETTGSKLHYLDSRSTPGAAPQRMSGIDIAKEDYILFADDDILLDPECLRNLWDALQSDPALGGVNCLIKNQQFSAPGRISGLLLQWMDQTPELPLAGRIVGPATNLLPADDEALPDVVPVEWLNTTCTLYRRNALPDPVFPERFTGASHFEDLALSAEVGKTHPLANARTARIFHDSQPGSHKADHRAHARQELLNRHFVMSEVLGRKSAGHHFWLAVSHFYQTFASGMRSPRKLLPRLLGSMSGLGTIALGKN